MAEQSNYFTDDELNCRHCGAAGVDPEALVRLNALRSIVGVALPLTSGYRCRNHPEERKKADPGYHNKGVAFDIAITNGVQRALILKHAPNLGFNGIGLSDKFIHIDLRSTPTSWTY